MQFIEKPTLGEAATQSLDSLIKEFLSKTPSIVPLTRRIEEHYALVKNIIKTVERFDGIDNEFNIINEVLFMNRCIRMLRISFDFQSTSSPADKYVWYEVINRLCYKRLNNDQKYIFNKKCYLIFKWRDFYISYNRDNSVSLEAEFQLFIEKFKLNSDEKIKHRLVSWILRGIEEKSFYCSGDGIPLHGVNKRWCDAFSFIQFIERESFLRQTNNNQLGEWSLFKEYENVTFNFSQIRYNFILTRENLEKKIKKERFNSYAKKEEFVKWYDFIGRNFISVWELSDAVTHRVDNYHGLLAKSLIAVEEYIDEMWKNVNDTKEQIIDQILSS